MLYQALEYLYRFQKAWKGQRVFTATGGIFNFLFIFVGHRHLSRYDAMDPTNASIINRTTTSSAAAMDYIKEPLASKYLRLIAYSVIFLLTITGNALVLAVVYKIRELHTGKHVILTVTS